MHYDGHAFRGWQVQPDERTVQQELETALGRLLDRETTVVAAGRTDSGVHATGQVASALMSSRWTADTLLRALNAVLPDDVWIAAADEVPLDFHARYDALARGYHYRVGTEPVARSPFIRRWCWPLAAALAPDALRAAAQRFPGTHSFRAFAKAGQPERGEQCTVYRAEWREWRGRGHTFHVVANRFLHHMVRYMVGTMVDVARGRRALGDIDALLSGSAALETSPPAPPEGLFLSRVYYTPNEWEAEERNDEVLPG